MGGDLGGLRDGRPQNLRWGTAHAPVPPIFWEVVLSDACESTNWVKRCHEGIPNDLVTKSFTLSIKIPDDLFCHLLSICNFTPLFSKTFYISPYNSENFFSPSFLHISPYFHSIYVFLRFLLEPLPLFWPWCIYSFIHSFIQSGYHALHAHVGLLDVSVGAK